MPEAAEAPRAAEDRLSQLTRTITPDDLRAMTLDRSQLPGELAGFEELRKADLDNAAYARSGDVAITTEALAEANRLDGYETGFAVPQGGSTLAEEPAELLEASTAVHLFERPEDAQAWIDATFVDGFLRSVGETDALDRRVTGVERLDAHGFYGHAAGMFVLRDVPGGELASTIVEFQVGRVLGVATAVAKVDRTYLDLACDLGSRLERQIVRVVLGG